MENAWIVTPYFFDQHDAVLAQAVPATLPFHLNAPQAVTDRSPAALGRVHRPIAAFVRGAAGRGARPVSVAGDCGASLPVMAGLQQAGLAPVLVWLDAHGDFNTAETSPSGFLGGMPLAMMVGRGDLALARESGLIPVPEADVWLVDARDLDPLEAEAVAASDLNRCGLRDLAGLAFDRPVHLHIDNDVVDAREVPANNYPVPGGPGLEETLRALAGFAASNRIAAVSLSGWNGRLEGAGRTARACARLLGAALGG